MSNDRRAQFELYKLYSKGMYNICMRMVNNESDAEDIIQHSFMDVFSKLHMFKFESSIGAWIKRIVINNTINFLKKRKLQISELNDQIQLSVQDEQVDDVQQATVGFHRQVDRVSVVTPEEVEERGALDTFLVVHYREIIRVARE